MVSITMSYQGNLHCEAVHGPSGSILQTDAPKDNMGKGESFSPTDLVATALGTCVLTTMGIVARRLEVNMDGATASVEKAMQPAPDRRIASLTVHIHMPAQGYTEEQRKKLEHAAHHCPVHKSMHPDVQMPITFHWA